MPISKKRSLINAFAVAVLLLFAYCLRFVWHPLTDNALLGITMMTARWVIHITLTVFWCLSIRRRILSRPIRRLLLSVGLLLLFWQIVRIIKYDYVIITEPIGRYCWYCFYIPMVLVPTLGVFIIDHLGKPEGYRSPKAMRLLFIPALLLIAVVLTNDYHQLVFTFPEGFKPYNTVYEYGFMYILEMAWFVLFGLYFVIMLLLKSRVPGSRSFQKLPLMIMLGAIAFWAGYSMRLYSGDLTAMDCIIIMLLLESAIQSGLIPSNMNYNELFRQSTIAAQIVDSDGRIHYSSSAAAPLDVEIIKCAIDQPLTLGDTLLNSQKITGGHVLWQDDIKEINDLTAHLRETNDLLSEQNELMQAEVVLRERRLQAEEKSRLYDRIAREIAPRLDKADSLLEESRRHPEKTGVCLSRLCFISAYIKRRANLILLGEESQDIPSRELESCLRESLSNLQLCGVSTSLDCRCAGTLRVDKIVRLYDLFEDAAESLLDQLGALLITAECGEDGVLLRIQAGLRAAMDSLPALTLSGGVIRCEADGADLLIEARIPKGGA